jgi:hypothetical protein
MNKRLALVVDFNPHHPDKNHMNANVDVYLLDRYNHKVLLTSGVQSLQTDKVMSLNSLYEQIKNQYDEILCLFLAHSFDDIKDYVNRDQINQSRKDLDAPLFMYLISKHHSNKQEIVTQTLDMIEHGLTIKEMLINIHNMCTQDVFSMANLIRRVG